MILKFIFFISYIFFIYKILFKFDHPPHYSRLNSLTKGKYYIQKCLEGELINNNTLNIVDTPKISVIIPVYNCEKTIKASIRSIQNQEMQEIEIILVNDYSTDNTLNIIKELSLEDQRINIINNNKNMGTMYSRNIGILNSKGKYVMNLDNDDLFLNSDIFDILFKEAEKENVDILGFAAVESYTYSPLITQMHDAYFQNHKNGLYLQQPELTFYPFTKNNKFRPNDYHVWGRFVKSNLYKKAINNLGISAIGEDRRTQMLIWSEDSSMSLVLYSLADSYKYIKIYGIFHYLSKTTASNTRHIDQKLFGEIYFLDLMYDFTGNNYIGIKYVVDKAKEMRYDSYYNLDNKYNVLYYKAVITKIINCEYISDKDKTKIKSLYYNLLSAD